MTKKLYKLKPEFMKKGEVKIGGFRPGQPMREKLTMESPYVEGEEYSIYVPDILMEVTRPPKVADKIKGIKALTKLSSGRDKADVTEDEGDSEVLSATTDDMEDIAPEEVETTADHQELVNVKPEFPSIQEGEEIPLETEDEELESLPEPEELSELNRSELEAVSIKLGVLDQIQGSGSGGYITVSDFEDFLSSVLRDKLNL